MIKISIIIPCLNEEKFIKKCLESVLKFKDLDKYDYEILLYDGLSKDQTKNIIHQFINHNNRIKLFDNPGIIQSTALNLGIKQANGDYILRLDAHAEYPEDYLKKLIETSISTNADNVGGIWITQPYSNDYPAQLVQALTTHKFGIGSSGFRTVLQAGEVDTVPYGFYKKEIFEKIGFFDERLVRAQDYEINSRIRKNGGKIWLNPEIKINYFNQPNIFKFLRKQINKEAPYNVYMWYLAPYTFTLRHAITGFFTFGIFIGILFSIFFKWALYLFLAIAAIYFILALASSIQQAIRYKKALHILALPFSFFIFHFIHGTGIIIGIFKILFGISPVQKIKQPWQGATFNKIKINQVYHQNK